MMATKEQERKALAQIRKIVEGLGEDSYVATAFEGCFEMAESNIDDDFGCSWKQTALQEREQRMRLEEVVNMKACENEQLQNQLEEISKRVLNKDDLNTVRSIVVEQHREAQNKLRESAGKIVEFCEDTDSEEFQKAVRDRKTYMAMDKEYFDLEATLYEISKAY